MAFPIRAAHTGMAASAGVGGMQHGHAQQMGFAASNRLNMAHALGGAPAAPGGAPNAAQGDFRQHAAAASGVPGVQAPEVHAAIDALTQAGHLTPLQGTALKSHQGPLQGAAGQQTVSKIGQAVKVRRMMQMQQRQSQMAAAPPGAGAPPGAMGAPSGPMPQAAAPGAGMPNGGMPVGMGR